MPWILNFKAPQERHPERSEGESICREAAPVEERAFRPALREEIDRALAQGFSSSKTCLVQFLHVSIHLSRLVARGQGRRRNWRRQRHQSRNRKTLRRTQSQGRPRR